MFMTVVMGATPSPPATRPYIVTMNDVSVSGEADAHAAVSRTTSTLSQTYPREMVSIGNITTVRRVGDVSRRCSRASAREYVHTCN